MMDSKLMRLKPTPSTRPPIPMTMELTISDKAVLAPVIAVTKAEVEKGVARSSLYTPRLRCDMTLKAVTIVEPSSTFVVSTPPSNPSE
ncbi:hypothetical protein D3C77_475130 [compost metagenome]